MLTKEHGYRIDYWKYCCIFMSLVTKDLDAGLLKTLAYFHHQSSSTNDLGCTQELACACVESWVLCGLKTIGMVCILPNSLKGMKADPRYLDGTVAGCETWVYYHQSRPKRQIYISKVGHFPKIARKWYSEATAVFKTRGVYRNTVRWETPPIPSATESALSEVNSFHKKGRAIKSKPWQCT